MTAERLSIVLMTFGVSPKRQEYAFATVRSLCENLAADSVVGWYIADAGSSKGYVDDLRALILGAEQSIIGYHNVWQSAGANWNMGHEAAFKVSDVVLHMEDDFALQRPLDIRNYQAVLEERKDIGVIRLGLLPINLRAMTVGARGEIFLDIDKSVNYAWSGNPCLMHRRWWDKVGPFPVDLAPGETEVAYDGRLRRMQDAPAIWRPIDLGSYSPFGHIGDEQSYEKEKK